MPKTFRFLHCGDVHLGAGRQIHPERYLDLFRVFEEVTTSALAPEIDALLISGDLFDVKEPDVETLARAVACFRTLRTARPNLPILAIEGNHDMRKRARGAHRNERGVLDILQAAGLLTLLRPELKEDDTVDFSGAVAVLEDFDLAVIGLGYWREEVGKRFHQALAVASELPQSRVICLAHLMVMHDGLDPYHGSATLDELLPVPDKVVYVGLGHGHSKIDAASARHGGVFYSPGSLEFVHSRNTHKSVDTRGYFDVVVGAEVTATHRPTVGKRPFVHLKVDLKTGEMASFDALRQRVLERFRDALPSEGMRPILSVQLDGPLSFPAASYRASVIQRDLIEAFDAIQTFVRRVSSGEDGAKVIGFDVEGGYDDAVSAVLTELMGSAHSALGVPDNDTVLSQNLLEAVRGESKPREALTRCREHLARYRTDATEDVAVEVVLTPEGPPAMEMAQRAVAGLELLPDQGVALRVSGRTGRDDAGYPVVPDLVALERAVLEATGAPRCAVRIARTILAAGEAP